MNLPDNFRKTIQGVYGAQGRAWLEALPGLMEAATERCGLSELQTVNHLSYNYVAYALQGTKNVVLKIGVPHKELLNEMAALEIFNGQGAVLLLEKDSEQGMMLLERLIPGTMLYAVKDDEAATHIVVDVMLKLRRPSPVEDGFTQLSEWFRGFEKMRECFGGTTGPLDKKLVERAEASVKDFFTEKYDPTLMHGDLHHYNILSSERGWLAIDPKGVVGPSEYEVGPFLLNPHDKTAEEIDHFTERRVAILSERLGIEKERICEWAIAHAVLSAWWGLEDNTGWEHAMACARVFSRN